MGWEFLDLVPEDTNGQSIKDHTSIFSCHVIAIQG